MEAQRDLASGDGARKAGSKNEWEVCLLDNIGEEADGAWRKAGGAEGATQGEATISVLNIPEFELLVQY